MIPVKLMKAHCHSFPGRKYCWSAMNPYYGGHYPLRREAKAAAEKVRKKLAKKLGAYT